MKDVTPTGIFQIGYQTAENTGEVHSHHGLDVFAGTTQNSSSETALYIVNCFGSTSQNSSFPAAVYIVNCLQFIL